MLVYLRNKLFVLFVLLTIFLLNTTISLAAEPLGIWQETQNVNSPIANHISSANNNNLYIVGGSTSSVNPFNLSSSIIENGLLSAWEPSQTTSPPVYFHSGVSKNGIVYVLGGNTFPPPSSTNKAWSGKINSSGKIDLWVPEKPLPERLSLGGAVVVGNNIYFAGGFTDNSPGSPVAHSEIYKAPIGSDGVLGDWSLVGEIPVPRYGFGLVEHNNKLYVIGGRDSFGAFQDRRSVFVGTVGADGQVGAWEELDQLPLPLYTAQVIKLGKQIVVIGGDSNRNYSNKVYYADINSDGSLGEWTLSENTLPHAVCCGGVASTGNYVYVTGGFNSEAGYLDVVQFAPLTNPAGLSVPYYSQNALPWGPTEYDSTKALGALSETMDRWGCAVTSASMVLNFHGMDELADGTALDPGSLNEWLKNNNGYVSGKGKNGWYSYIIWNKISQLTRDLFQADKADYKLMYQRLYPGEETTTQLDEDLKTYPNILKVTNASTTGHFVVVKGSTDSTYAINDPEWNYPTLESFNNSYHQVDRFIPSQTDFSYINLVVNPEVKILVTDSQGRKTGVDENGNEFNEIPNAKYAYEGPISNPDQNDMSEDLGTGVNIFLLPLPELGQYKITISSDDVTPYTMHIMTFEKDGDSTHHTWEGVLSGSPAHASLNYENDTPSELIKERIVTYKSTIKDIQDAEKSGKIKKKSISKALIVLVKASELADKKRLHYVAKVELNVAKKLLNREKGRSVMQSAYDILIYDINYLLNKL